MCDTFYMRRPDGTTSFFAKNSDRDPNEPQYMLFVRAGSMSAPKTYVEMTSYEVKHDVWLSKPSWMWGAEMGVNSRGVSIGNEATFNKVGVDKTGVLGMDHLRAALELASTAREALEIIIENILRFGQGGNGGFENPLYYHNSYLIADPGEGYVLETVDRYYAYKKLNSNYNISNKISLKGDFDGISPESQGKVTNFERHFINPIVSYFAGAYHRESRGRELMERSHFDLAGAIDVLRDKQTGCVASMRNIGMVAGGLVSSQATASLICDYETGIIWYTEGPCPEIQLFKPLKFDCCGALYSQGEGTESDGAAAPQSALQLEPHAGPNDDQRSCTMSDENEGINRWKYNNLLFRAVLKDYDNKVAQLRPVLREYQSKLFELAKDAEGEELCHHAQAINTEYIQHALELVGEGSFKGGWQFRRYWRKQNEVLVRKEDDNRLRELYRRYLKS
ncbi:MAG: secernin [Bacillota bacterium]|jgi:secernin|nr:secernin [Candidatus Fermentithermobacillaceae bacterium]